MSVAWRFLDVELASGQLARVLRMDVAGFAVEPLFREEPSAAERRLAQVLGEARLGRALVPVPTADVRAEFDGDGFEGLAERARDGGAAHAAPLHLFRLAAARLGAGELLINANHFLFLPPELDGPFNAYGDPIGLTLAAGVVETPPQVRRACLVMEGVRPEIRRIGFADLQIAAADGSVFVPHIYGTPSGQGSAFALFHGSVGGCTPEGAGWDVAFVGRFAAGLKAGGGLSIPRAGCVLRCATEAQARAVAAGPLHYDLPGLSQGVQAGPVILEAGVITEEGRDIFAEEGMRADPDRPDSVPISPHAWAADWHKTRAARLSAGIDGAGRLFFCAVEGTSSFFRDGPARGATLHDLATLMRDQGAVTAMHLDGGGSTQVFCEGGGALIEPRDVHHGMTDSPAQFDRPLPLALRLG